MTDLKDRYYLLLKKFCVDKAGIKGRIYKAAVMPRDMREQLPRC